MEGAVVAAEPVAERDDAEGADLVTAEGRTEQKASLWSARV